MTHCPLHTDHPCTGNQLAVLPNRACRLPLVLETDFEKIGTGRTGLGFIGLSERLKELCSRIVFVWRIAEDD